MSIRRSDGVIMGDTRFGVGWAIGIEMEVTRLVRLTVGDWIEISVWQNAGTSVALDADFNSDPTADIAWLRP